MPIRIAKSLLPLPVTDSKISEAVIWSDPFKNSCGAHAAANTHGHHAILAVNFAPVQPSGWPKAIAPPLTLTLSGSNPSVLITASDWAAKASFNSITSISARVRPASLRALGIANTGPIPISSGGQPAVAYATNRAIGLAPSSFARESDITIAAAAPSDICEALPAVIVPLT